MANSERRSTSCSRDFDTATSASQLNSRSTSSFYPCFRSTICRALLWAKLVPVIVEARPDALTVVRYWPGPGDNAVSHLRGKVPSGSRRPDDLCRRCSETVGPRLEETCSKSPLTNPSPPTRATPEPPIQISPV